MSTKSKLVLLFLMCSVSAFSAGIWEADFETPDYSTGSVIGQQGWYPWGGSDAGAVVTSYGAITPPEGAQFAALDGATPPNILGNSNFISQISAVNFNSNYIHFSYKINASVNNNVGFYNGAPSLFYFHHAGEMVQLTWNGGMILGPAPWGEWHDIGMLIDGSTTTCKVLWVELNGRRIIANVDFSAAGLPRQMRVRAYDGTAEQYVCVDNFVMETMPAAAAVGPENPDIFMSDFTSSGDAKFINVGRESEFNYSASSTTAWILIDSGSESGHYSNGTASVSFTVDRTGLAPGTHAGTLQVDCGIYGVLTYFVTASVIEPSGGLFTLAGIQLMDINTRVDNTKYYQDTMFAETVPHSDDDGGMMDIVAIENFYLFGNDGLGDTYITDNLEDPGTAAEFEARGSFSTNTVYELDAGVYPLVNRLSNNGTIPTENTLAEYIAAAGMEKQPLNYALHEGVNRFTLLTPDAGEFSSQGLLGLYLFASNEVPDFTEGSGPTLAAIDDGGGILDAAGYEYVGYRSGDVMYFQSVDGVFANQTVAKTYGSYVVRITYFNMAGDNNGAVNPNGLTSSASVGYVCTPPGKWGIDTSASDNISFLEITIVQAPPEAAAGNTNLFVGMHEDGGTARLYNLGGSNYNYTAYSGTAWIQLDPSTSNGNVTATSPGGIEFAVDKTGLTAGYHVGIITADCGMYGTFYFNVTVRIVEPGVLTVHGLHLTELFGNGTAKYYQDTMIVNKIPRATWDGGQTDVAVIRGFYAFGNSFTTDYEAIHLQDSGPAQYNSKGMFTPPQTNVANAVYALNNAEYEILNPVQDNGTNPEITGGLADYIAAAALRKEELTMTLLEGTNRFTLIAGTASQIGDQGMVGLYVMEAGATAAFIPGALPTIAAADDGSEIIDAVGFPSCGYIAVDAAYPQAATNYFVNGSLTAHVGMYDVTITYFNIAGRNDPAINPLGMSGGGSVGWVSEFNINQWAILPEPNQAVAYLELFVEEIPEPGMAAVLLAVFLAVAIGRKRG